MVIKGVKNFDGNSAYVEDKFCDIIRYEGDLYAVNISSLTDKEPEVFKMIPKKSYFGRPMYCQASQIKDKEKINDISNLIQRNLDSFFSQE